MREKILRQIEAAAVEDAKKQSELMTNFTEPELRGWVHSFFEAHKQYISGIKFNYTNICLSSIVEGDLYTQMGRLEHERDLYDGMREAYSLAKADHLKVPEYLEMWIADTLSPGHLPPKRKSGRPKKDFFHHIVCECISKPAKYSPFFALRNDEPKHADETFSICDVVADELDMQYPTIKQIWVNRDRNWFGK